MTKTVLVTGAAGFIGKHVSERLMAEGSRVVGIDNLNDYYSPALKQARVAELARNPLFRFEKVDIGEPENVRRVFDDCQPQEVVHLAAQAGVRYALDHPYAYSGSNLTGSTAILEACRHHQVRHLVFASSSSVYGGNVKVPFAETDPVDHPVSFYAATKRANELMAHSYSHLFSLPVTMLRYFTVYGPWGRPDMAIWKFTHAMLRGQPIDVFGQGVLSRDFTYVGDAAEATVRLLAQPPARRSSADPADWTVDRVDSSWAPFETYNIGRSDPVSVNDLITLLESIVGRKAIRNEMPMQPGDVEKTFSDTGKLKQATGFEPVMPLAKGLQHFVDWFRPYHGL